MTEYWEKVIAETLAAHGVQATPEQIAGIAEDLRVEQENYGLALHSPSAGENLRQELLRLERALAEERAKVTCEDCNGSGETVISSPNFSSVSTCLKCHGSGRRLP